jgi:phosphoserine phosphatase RsbU/P
MPVLVVDDIAENRDIRVRRLQRFGIIGIEQAANGQQALEASGGAISTLFCSTS